MTRGGSSDSEDSILSHITVVARDSPPRTRPAGMSTASRSSIGASSLQSTPPTSLDGLAGEVDASKKTKRRRVSRARSSLSTLASETGKGTPFSKHKVSLGKEDLHSKTSSRAVSGVTLVEGSLKAAPKRLRNELDIDMHWDMLDEPGQDDADDANARRRASRRSQIGTSAQDAADTIAAATTSLGKRVRGVADAFKDKASSLATRTSQAQTSQSPSKRTKDELSARKFPNIRKGLPKEEKQKDVIEPEEPPKPLRMPRVQKVYQTKGLYAGQTRGFDPTVTEGSNNKKKHAKVASTEVEKENQVLPLPMFGTYKRLTIDDMQFFAPYKLPADILGPLRKEQNPKDWSRLNKNRFIGDAAATWSTKAWKKLDHSSCLCEDKCDEGCINREMSYECNEKMCTLGQDCGNRPFAELAFRYKNKNFSRLREGEKPEANLWGEGIETVKTEGRGFGVRAMRPFKPNQIIVEYCGEIITQEEADRRMNEDYKDKKDYYLMDFHGGMIIDATRGSICRFVNHSCDPNCRVEKWIVNGEPRMALFAGADGIMTGEELTYDYNFEVFSKNSTQQCLCGSPNCRGILGPKHQQSKTKQLAGAVKGVIQGVKRKVEKMVHGDNENYSTSPRKRVRIGPKDIINKVKKQISSTAPAVAPADAKAAQARKDERAKREAKRAAERAAREDAERLLKNAMGESDDDEPMKQSKVERHRSMSTTIMVSDLPKSRKSATPRSPKHPSMSPAKRISNVKSRVVDTLKAAVTGTPAPRNTSQTPLLKSSSSSSSAEAKAMRQSRLSFGPVGIGFNISPKKRDSPDENDSEDVSGGPEIPKRNSSLKAGTSSTRPTTAKSLAKGVSKVAAAAKIGLQGDQAIRKTIRAVSGAE